MPTKAICPGRICLGGEDLDWMGGSTLQAAIDLAITATADCRQTSDDGKIHLASAWPIEAQRSIKASELHHQFEDHLDFPQMALLAVAQAFGAFEGSITLTSTLPIAAGLASSAASLIATIAAVASELGTRLPTSEVCELAYQTETVKLKTGAGRMDFFACAYGGTRLMRFENEREIDSVTFPDFATDIVICNSGLRAATRKSITGKRARFQQREQKICEYQRLVSDLVEKMVCVLSSGGSLSALGALVTACHRSLSTLLQSSTPVVDDMVDVALSAGSNGAKLTGGGEGGCMFALPSPSGIRAVAQALESVHGRTDRTCVSPTGLVVRSQP